jgi:hypothetical protein
VVPENDAVKINKNDCPQLDLFDWRPPAPTMATLERELRDARQDLHNLQVMQMKPGTQERLELLRKLEVSCRAEAKLRRKALAYNTDCSQGDQRRNLRQRRQAQAVHSAQSHLIDPRFRGCRGIASDAGDPVSGRG